MKRRLSDEQESQLAAAYLAGQSGISLARDYKVDVSVAYDAIRRQGGRVRPLKESNAETVRAALLCRTNLLSDSTKREIAERYQRGESSYAISRTMPVSQGHVIRVLRDARVKSRSIREARREYPLDESAFLNANDNQDAAYFVGLIMADGCIGRRRYGWTLTLSLSGDDGKHVDRLRKFLKTECRVRTSHRQSTNGWNSKPTHRLTITSTPLAESLATYGVTERKSMSAKVIGLENNRHFWRGAIDGDGFVYIAKTAYNPKPVIGLVGSKAMMEQFSTFARTITDCKARVSPMANIWRVEICSRHAVALVRHLYSDCTVALPRKLAKAREILAL